MKHQTNYYSGLSAEVAVGQRYAGLGYEVLAQRWRGRSGEIDLIARRSDEVVFIEVKQSSTFARAAESLGARQIRRIFSCASEFLATLPTGALTPSRFDVALVDGQGQIDVLENALCA
jgi:putative endonuclease